MVEKNKISLATPHMSEQGFEQEFVQSAFDTNWIAPLGPNVDGFEQELADMVGVDHAAALSSGTSAIHLALRAAGVGENDIVLCQSLTFSASANPIIYEKAIPVFIDSDMETWNMDPNALEKALKKYPETKAVIIVHLYGYSANLDKIVALCEEYGVTLIEDAAESLGSMYKGKQTGTFGKFGIFSFNGNKIITTSGGGMLVSNDGEAIQKIRKWATQSRDNAPWYQHSELGYNYRLSNVLAGIGRGQLKVLADRVAKKRYINQYYREAFKDIPEIQFKEDFLEDEPNYWLSTITFEGISPSDVLKALSDDNIEGRHLWKPMHLQPFFEQYDYIGGNNAKMLFNTGICLPSDTKMTDEDIERICEVIRGVFGAQKD